MIQEKTDYRLPYRRDIDCIIQSKAFARYADKTQVAYLIEDDHISYRGLHVQLVSSYARGIAEILGLDVNLVEAISLGHDVGHPPFGHEGEQYLSALSKEFNQRPFTHPLQSCRLFTIIEPLNLSLEVYDGFLCHDGGLDGIKLIPNANKGWKDHECEKEQKAQNPEINLVPATKEGCLVKICDTISYIARDIEDALRMGLITRDQVPETVLGNNHRDILQILGRDIIECSHGKDFIAFSEESHKALHALRDFNFQKIYFHPHLKVESKKIERSYRILFTSLLDDHRKEHENSHLSRKFLKNKSAEYVNGSNDVQMVVDYISGMTDHYFIRTLEKIIIPQEILL